MSDTTEAIRRQQLIEINSNVRSREALEAEHGQVWNTDELKAEFEVDGFLAPYVIVRRIEDRITGSLLFQGEPRLYFYFEPE